MLLGSPGSDEHSDADADANGQIVVLCKEQLCPFITAPSFVQQEQQPPPVRPLLSVSSSGQSGHLPWLL